MIPLCLCTCGVNAVHINVSTSSSQAIESRTLALSRTLTQQLQTTCVVLVSSLQGLPSHIQQEALSLSRSAAHIYTNFSKAKVLGDLPDSVLTNCKVQLGKMKNSLDNVMDYLVNNTPLNWLVGPFYPRIAPEQTPEPASAASSTRPACSISPSTQPIREEPMEVEMESLQSQQQQWSITALCWAFGNVCINTCDGFVGRELTFWKWIIKLLC